MAGTINCGGRQAYWDAYVSRLAQSVGMLAIFPSMTIIENINWLFDRPHGPRFAAQARLCCGVRVMGSPYIHHTV